MTLQAERGDLTVHLSCALHRSTHPASAERRVVYTGFALSSPRRRGRTSTTASLAARRRACAGRRAGFFQSAASKSRALVMTTVSVVHRVARARWVRRARARARRASVDVLAADRLRRKPARVRSREDRDEDRHQCHPCRRRHRRSRRDRGTGTPRVARSASCTRSYTPPVSHRRWRRGGRSCGRLTGGADCSTHSSRHVAGSAAVCLASISGHMGAFDPEMDAVLDVAAPPRLRGALPAQLSAEPDPGSTYRLAKRGLIRLCERAAVAGERLAAGGFALARLDRHRHGTARAVNHPIKEHMARSCADPFGAVDRRDRVTREPSRHRRRSRVPLLGGTCSLHLRLRHPRRRRSGCGDEPAGLRF